MITAIINLIGTLAICATVLIVTFLIIKTYLTVKGIGTTSGLLNWFTNFFIVQIEAVIGRDINGDGSVGFEKSTTE